ncbi:MAG: recombination mediator RecR [Thermoleophilia bacterium]|nr:recombination mediator RecR [Thermoleophilia bacterium]
MFSPAVQKLITELTKLPGIGPRTAQRLAFHLLRLSPEEVLPLAYALIEVKETVRFCRRCFHLTEQELCTICTDPTRDQTVICVVEEPADLISIERTHEYHGLYHVLGGALSPLDGIGPEKLHLQELFDRVEEEGVREVIVATNPNLAGEATALYIAEQLKPLTSSGSLRVTRPAAGLPMGGDLEYADEVTLGRALAARREF